MRLPLLISLSLLLCAAPNLRAQLAAADDFFHGGAQLYITNNVAQAKEVVAQGRKLYPDDEKLKKLEELLNQKNQQQQQQQDQSQQQKSEDQKDQQQNQQPKKSEDQKPQEEQKKADEQKAKEQPKPDEQKKDGDQPDKKEAEAPPVKPGEMTPEEAKRLLDAQKGHEQLLQLKPDAKPRNNSRPVKDW